MSPALKHELRVRRVLGVCLQMQPSVWVCLVDTQDDASVPAATLLEGSASKRGDFRHAHLCSSGEVSGAFLWKSPLRTHVAQDIDVLVSRVLQKHVSESMEEGILAFRCMFVDEQALAPQFLEQDSGGSPAVCLAD